MTILREYYESGNAPHEALGRAARRLMQGGALYLGGGVGVEKLQTAQGAASYALTGATGKAQTFGGPLSAVIRAYAVAGASKAPDTPGGAASVPDPAAAARLRELADEESEAKRDIERFERRLARKATDGYMPGGQVSDEWEQRRIEELHAALVSIAAERRKLIAAGKVEEAEQARPGANWTKIPAANVAKLKGIVQHYKAMAHPFTSCVRDQIKHGLSEDHANRRCAVVKDLGQQSTKWRKGGKGKVSEECERLLVEALDRIGTVEEALGPGMSVALAEGMDAPASLDTLGEALWLDFSLLALAGHPVAEMVIGPLTEFATPKVREVKRGGAHGGFDPSLHPRDREGQFARKGSSPGASPAAAVTTGRRPAAIASDSRERKAASMAGHLAPETQKGIAAQVDALITSGMGRRQAISRIATNRSLTITQVADFHRQHGHSSAQESDRGEGIAMLLEGFQPPQPVVKPQPKPGPAAAPNAQREAARRSGQRVKKPGQGGPAGGHSTYDESKHKRGAKGTTEGGQFVKSGSSGTEAKAVQRRVGAKEDGKFGPKTAQAVRDFQRRHRLVVDGVVGHQTALALAGKYAKARAAKTGALRDDDRKAMGATKAKPRRGTRGRTPDRRRGGRTVG